MLSARWGGDFDPSVSRGLLIGLGSDKFQWPKFREDFLVFVPYFADEFQQLLRVTVLRDAIYVMGC